MVSGKLGERFTIHEFESGDYLNIEDHRVNLLKSHNGIDWGIIDNGIQLRTYTEVTYDIPANTTLVNITGPLGEPFSCYTAVKPAPAWWGWSNYNNKLGYLLVSSHRPEVRSETFLVFPLDPTVKYNLSMGGDGNKTALCNVGGVTSYSFFR